MKWINGFWLFICCTYIISYGHLYMCAVRCICAYSNMQPFYWRLFFFFVKNLVLLLLFALHIIKRWDRVDRTNLSGICILCNLSFKLTSFQYSVWNWAKTVNILVFESLSVSSEGSIHTYEDVPDCWLCLISSMFSSKSLLEFSIREIPIFDSYHLTCELHTIFLFWFMFTVFTWSSVANHIIIPIYSCKALPYHVYALCSFCGTLRSRIYLFINSFTTRFT